MDLSNVTGIKNLSENKLKDKMKVLFINCSLKSDNKRSHTERLFKEQEKIYKSEGIEVEKVRAVEYDFAAGTFPDMTKHGAKKDDWPKFFEEKVDKADILVIGSPIWLGEPSSIWARVMERLYSMSGQTNDKGQYIYYGKVAGCVITGNEDGVKNCAKSILYSLGHIGYTIPPQVDTGWIGEIGPGKSYGDDGAGLDNEYTKKTTQFMAWNLIHFARMLKENNGIPNKGNNLEEFEGRDKKSDNPEHR